jgi:hypothetical protein
MLSITIFFLILLSTTNAAPVRLDSFAAKRESSELLVKKPILFTSETGEVVQIGDNYFKDGTLLGSYYFEEFKDLFNNHTSTYDIGELDTKSPLNNIPLPPKTRPTRPTTISDSSYVDDEIVTPVPRPQRTSTTIKTPITTSTSTTTTTTIEIIYTTATTTVTPAPDFRPVYMYGRQVGYDKYQAGRYVSRHIYPQYYQQYQQQQQQQQRPQTGWQQPYSNPFDNFFG